MFRQLKNRLVGRPFKSSAIGAIIAALVTVLIYGWAVFCALFLIGVAGFGIYLLIDWLRKRLDW